MLAYSNALESVFIYFNGRKIGGASSYVADKNFLNSLELFASFMAMGPQPCVEGCLGLLQQGYLV